MNTPDDHLTHIVTWADNYDLDLSDLTDEDFEQMADDLDLDVDDLRSAVADFLR